MFGDKTIQDGFQNQDDRLAPYRPFVIAQVRAGTPTADIIDIIAVAEESNTLEKVLIETADSNERRTGQLIDLAVRLIEPLIYFKGYHALQTHRIGHRLWNAGRKDFALYLQSLVSRFLQVDIHPAARIGQGIMIDHAHSIVIGEKAADMIRQDAKR